MRARPDPEIAGALDHLIGQQETGEHRKGSGPPVRLRWRRAVEMTSSGTMSVGRDVQRHLRLSRYLQAAGPDELLRHGERPAVEQEAEQGMSRLQRTRPSVSL
jgi:hypothetical protein